MKICFVTSECEPYVKTGGLADVSGSLPKALADSGGEIKIFLPFYDLIPKDKFGFSRVDELSDMKVTLGEKEYRFSVLSLHHYDLKNVTAFFIDCPDLYNRGSVYTNDEDEDARFILLQYAVLLTLQKIKWSPDVFHCNDWQSSLIPALLKLNFSWDSMFFNSRTMLSIHNIGYQGIFGKESMLNANFSVSNFTTEGPFEFNGKMNFLKAGISFADLITTVSPTYSKEIQTPEYGAGLDGVLNSKSSNIIGILNGIDDEVWNPDKDLFIPFNFDINTLGKKDINKMRLLEKTGLKYSADIPVFGIVSRLAWQKGIDIMFGVFEKLMNNNLQLIVLGTGDREYEKFFTDSQAKFGDRLSVKIGFDNELAHLITAGSDFFIMPSRYEPCGLNQMYSLNYGTVPIVRKTGGLADTVRDVDEAEGGNGIVFTEFSESEFLMAVQRALLLYKDEEALNTARINGMKSDFSWNRSARNYRIVYDLLSSKKND